MPQKPSIIPKGDGPLYDFAKVVMDFTEDNHERWLIMPVSAKYKAILAEFETLLLKVQKPDHSVLDEAKIGELRVELTKELRGHVQGRLMRNPEVTDADKKAMGLPIYDRIPTPVLDPAGQAEAILSYPGRAQLLVQIKPVAGSQNDPQANYGCRIYYGLYTAGDTLPASGMDLRESLFTRKKKELFTFLPTESGKTAYFSIRYENSKGKAGPWGPLAWALIP